MQALPGAVYHPQDVVVKYIKAIITVDQYKRFPKTTPSKQRSQKPVILAR